ncbi:MAG: hypothetical protein WCO88_11915 [Actinomycetota bacterium]
MTLLDAVSRAVKVASAEHCTAVLVGGLAVSARAEPRFTRDADLVIAIDTDSHAEFVIRSFITQGYRLQAVLEQSGVGRLSGARLVDPEGFEVDLLTASSGIEAEIVADADEIDIVPGLSLHVAAIGHLIALKLLSVAPGRETDAADLRALAEVADRSEWDRAVAAVELITERGFNRGRDLMGDLIALRSTITE